MNISHLFTYPIIEHKVERIVMLQCCLLDFNNINFETATNEYSYV